MDRELNMGQKESYVDSSPFLSLKVTKDTQDLMNADLKISPSELSGM